MQETSLSINFVYAQKLAKEYINIYINYFFLTNSCVYTELEEKSAETLLLSSTETAQCQGYRDNKLHF